MRSINTNLKVPLLDAIDRFTIIELKRERLRDEKDRGAVENECAFYGKTLDSYRRDDGVEIKDAWLQDMRDINAQIWDVEGDIRNAKRNGLSFEEVGHLAVKLRDLNDIRTVKRNAIAKEMGADFYDIPKKDYAGGDIGLLLPLHETIDRVTIAQLKLERLPHDEKYPQLEKEHDFFQAILASFRAHGVEIKQEWIDGMKDINGRVWDRESAIRQGREKEFGLEEMGRRTLELREMSKERVAWKNKIAEAGGSDFYEVKTEVI